MLGRWLLDICLLLPFRAFKPQYRKLTMAKSLPANFVVVFLLSVVVDRSSGSSTIELNVAIAEELPVGTVVANLAADAGLDSEPEVPEFEIVSGSFYRYFRLGADTTRTSRDASEHLLIVDQTIDREVICKHRLSCLLLQLNARGSYVGDITISF